VIDRIFAKDVADREPAVARTDHDGREVFDGVPLRRLNRFRALDDFYGDVGGIRHDVVHRRALLRLGNQRLDILL
jgi:hypothetical protein